jgi:hypothetical protein
MGPGVDQIADGLRLEEVQSPVQHGAPGELTRVSLARSGAYRRREHGGRDVKAAMGRDLEKIFSRKGVRRAVEGGDDVVENLTIVGIDDMGVAGPAWFE